MLGRTLGNYGVVSKIGEGGMGVVYLARHATLGRPAAVKVLRPALSSDHEVVSRFFNEARAATAVRHPGVVEVYDFGFLEDQTAYIIMEYLDGESLAARIRRRASTIRFTLATLRAIAGALQAVHDHDIVHRDLKPDNVFLIPDHDVPTGCRIKLLDFGIAKLAALKHDVRQTTTGTVLGTPLYMSPEQCRGSGRVDHRADLYSLGCIAYEMLCGQPPFAVQGSGDVMARHLYFDPPPLRPRRGDISVELEAVVLRLLQKEPRARHRTAQELIHALDQLMALATAEDLAGDGVPTVALPSGQESGTTLTSAAAQTREARTTGHHDRRLMLLAGVPTLAIAMIVLIVLLVGNSEADRERVPGAGPTSPPGDAAGTDAGVDGYPRLASPPPRPDDPAAEPLPSGSRDVRPQEAAAQGSAAPERVTEPLLETEQIESRPLPVSIRAPARPVPAEAAPAAKHPEPRAAPRTQAPAPKRWLRCSAPAAVAGERAHITCQVFNTSDHPVYMAKYKVRVGIVAPIPVEGPSELPAHSASDPFSFDVATPVNPGAETLSVSTFLIAPPDVKYTDEIHIQVTEPTPEDSAATSSP